jgi:UDP-perosamine 4-acetyltransferase
VADPAPLVIVGAGGHAKVVIDIFRAHAAAFRLVGVTDADPRAREVNGAPVLGDDAQLAELRRQGVAFAFVALGDNARRADLAARVIGLGFRLANAVSPGALVSPSATLGVGVAVMAGAVINAEAVVGDGAIVNSGAVLEHDTRIGRFAHLGPNSTVAGRAQVGDRTLIGAGATVIPGVRIGSDVVVGAGAVVVTALESGVVAVGAPARAAPRPGTPAP